ncbi:hypothetical protein AN189_04580 [Loktanella sp. 3ANDIMAR09]|uniref:EF-hand domain-containing protein n=1 Tax=Loktanella gaetbuli TaxID=2881335 RepID=A0ABS8BQ65_9RHOB|nr:MULTISPECIES: hypothetical protein [Loktanella]KQI69672.1 hypothetical protein AN189_04580 [Loktanella sp. 3ANDIMAR09]MCB5197863.1 hypothetical protein [Loktanella gaetbuli]
MKFALLIPAAVLTLAGCDAAQQNGGPGLTETYESIQDQYPDITPELFARFDRDGDGLLSGFEQQQLFSQAQNPNGITGTLGRLDDDEI